MTKDQRTSARPSSHTMPEIWRKVLQDREAGRPFKDIANDLGVTDQRARQIFDSATKRNRFINAFAGTDALKLSVRALNILHGLGIDFSVQAVRARFESGFFDQPGRKILGLGPSMLSELRQFAGIYTPSLEESPYHREPAGIKEEINRIQADIEYSFKKSLQDVVESISGNIRIKASGEFRPGIQLSADLYDPAFERWSEENTHISLTGAIRAELEVLAWHYKTLPEHYFDDLLDALEETRKEVEDMRHEYEQQKVTASASPEAAASEADPAHNAGSE